MSKIPYVFFPIPPELTTDEFMDDPLMRKVIFAIFSKIQTVSHVERLRNFKTIELGPYEFIYGREAWETNLGIPERRLRNRMLRLENEGIIEKIPSKTRSTYTVFRIKTESFMQVKNDNVNKIFETSSKTSSTSVTKTSSKTSSTFPAENKALTSFEEKNVQQNVQQNVQHFSHENVHKLEAKSEEANLFRLEKEANKKKKSLAPCSPPLKSKIVVQEDLDVLQEWCVQSQLAISTKSLTTWLRKWEAQYVTEHIMLMCKRKVTNHESWMESALKNDYVGEESRIKRNREFAQKIQFEYGWSDLNITEKYCTDVLTGKDFQFRDREDLFQERLLNEAKQKQEGAM